MRISDWNSDVCSSDLAELVEGVTISTSPFAPSTHWQQIYLPLLQAHELAPGDMLELTLGSDTRLDVGVRVSWTTQQKRAGKIIAEQSPDTLRGQLLNRRRSGAACCSSHSSYRRTRSRLAPPTASDVRRAWKRGGSRGKEWW